ncbi:tetratricopeptide repeat protein [Novosphingobium sp. FKTRR1]|uniref:tetratricopeptide repeat protein n=1 Tax=unclassified Novosphingobium TaxID=2644732 RepID=UPI00351CD7F9
MPAAILLNGVLEYRAGNVNLAVENLDRLVRMQPDNLQARQLLARALVRQGDWLRVARDFDGDARQPNASPYLLTLVGKAATRMGDRARGAAYALRAAHPVRHGAIPIAVATPLGVLASQYQDKPNYAAMAVPYVRGLLLAGQREDAQVVADRLRDANPGAAEANLLAGDVRLLRGDARGALIDYGNGASIRFNEPVLRRMDAALRALGRNRDADAMASRYLAQNPGSVLAMKLLAASWAGPPANPARAALVKALGARGQQAPQR